MGSWLSSHFDNICSSQFTNNLSYSEIIPGSHVSTCITSYLLLMLLLLSIPPAKKKKKKTPLPNLLLKCFLVGHSELKISRHIPHTSRNDLRPCLTMLVTLMCIKIWKHFSPRYVQWLFSSRSSDFLTNNSSYCCTSNTSSLSTASLLN